MTQLTVTGPYINKTLFDQAGVEVLGRRRDLGRMGGGGEESRGEPEACRSRSAGTAPAIASRARRSPWAPRYIGEDGKPAVIDDGFKAMAEPHRQVARGRHHAEGGLGRRRRPDLCGAERGVRQRQRRHVRIPAPGRSASSPRRSATPSTGGRFPRPAGRPPAPACRAAPRSWRSNTRSTRRRSRSSWNGWRASRS